MCTVTYLPLPDQHYILTSNRDESLQRPIALPVTDYRVGEQTLYFPKDPQGGGTWIATSGKDATVCLLNGAFVPHPLFTGHVYRKSRGLVVLDYFAYDHVDAYAQFYDFDNIEPFTLVVIENKTPGSTRLTELRWDGSQIIQTPMDAQVPHIWSSAQLYPPEVAAQRREWFREWLHTHTDYLQESILQFHRFAGDGNSHSDLIVDMGMLHTVSICSMQREAGQMTTVYEDVQKAETHRYVVPNEV